MDILSGCRRDYIEERSKRGFLVSPAKFWGNAEAWEGAARLAQGSDIEEQTQQLGRVGRQVSRYASET